MSTNLKLLSGGAMRSLLTKAVPLSATAHDAEAARAFIAFMASPDVARIIRELGMEPRE